MSLVVNTNMGSQIAQRNLFNAGNTLSTTMQRLSSGLRINSAADDAAGLSLAKKLSAQVSASSVAKSNAQTGINMIQTGESDLAVIQDNLQRMRDLSVQASNGVYSSSERKMLNSEFQNRISEIDRIAKSSKFSSTNLLDGSITGSLNLQIGTDNIAGQDTIDISSIFKNFKAGQGVMPTVSNSSVSTASLATIQISAMSTAISAVSSARSLMGATINRLQGAISRIDTKKENMASSLSVIQDADVASESANLTRTQILKQAATAMLTQANQTPQLALRLLQ